MTKIEQKDSEIAILKRAFKDACDDLRRYKCVIESFKTAEEVAELVNEWKDRTIRAQTEELICYRIINGN